MAASASASASAFASASASAAIKATSGVTSRNSPDRKKRPISVSGVGGEVGGG